ncbi:BglG family transcription antiterminator [Clostridium oryzae]|uniref:Putative licABCH operon regulator n=1 Tax=Clostridium oryzae TaxID=1450648 RepID=A0A1V4IDJ2_9CLOT|nr:BglG family transcription antiterminator [Clostridium oryzae]OPJ57950.1 putative licABCH operon regulator [Clostridium oryzae]
MRKREKVILHELLNQKEYITSEALAQIANVTSRTIRDDIRKIKDEIEKHGANLESHSGIGYKIVITNYKLFGEFLNTLKIKEVAQYEDIPDDSDDRVNYLIKKFITVDFPIKIEELVDELCVSRSTLTSELKEVRKKIGKYDLRLEQKPGYGIFIEGSEISKRLCISEFFFHSSADKGYFAEESVLFNSSVNREEVFTIKSTLIDVLQKYKVMISDVSLQNLVIHVIISLRRARFYNYVHFEEKQINFLKSEREYVVASEISQILSSKFNEIWPVSEVAYLTIHLLGKKILIQNESETFNSSIMAKLLVEKIIFDINEKSEVDLHNDEEFRKVLCLHLDPLLIRLKLGLINRNPMINDIKMNYAHAFRLAEIAGKVIQDEVDLVVNEDEIGYIALYIGLALEKLEKKLDKKSILLVSTMGRSSAQLQKYKILNQFKEYVNCFDIIDMYQFPNVDNSKYDFILSSVHINYKVNTPIIYVNEILQSQDMKLIQNAILDIKSD